MEPKTIGEILRGMRNGDIIFVDWGVWINHQDVGGCTAYAEYRIYENFANAMTDENDDRYIDGGVASQGGIDCAGTLRALENAHYIRRIGNEYELLDNTGKITGRVRLS